ncbi:hypothetical protein SLA2020_170360 [Shorea laevis]
MEEIFGKTVEKPDIERKNLKLPSRSKFEKLPTAREKFEVRDENDRTWNCHCSKSSDKSYLNVEGWDHFVETQGIKAGRSWIGLQKEDDSFSPGATPYKFKVRN